MIENGMINEAIITKTMMNNREDYIMKKYITTFALVLLAAVTMFLAEPSEAQARAIYYEIKSFEVSSIKCKDGKMTIKFDKENGIFKIQ